MSGETVVGGAGLGTGFNWGATNFFLSLCMSFNDGEGEAVAKVSSAAGTYSLLSLYAHANAGVITARTRVNAANGNGVVATTSTGTGWFTDVSNSDTVADGDKVCLNISSTGNPTEFGAVVAQFVGSVHPVFYLGRGAASSGNNGGNYFVNANGGSIDGTEAGAQVKWTGGGTISHITTFEINGFQTFKSRVAGATGNLSVIGAPSTWAEDAVHSDTVTAGQGVCMFVGATSTERTYHEGMRYTCDNGSVSQELIATTATTGNINTTTYINPCAGGGNGGVEVDNQLKMPFAIKSQTLQIYEYAAGGNTTARLRVNGANGNQVISSSGTGRFTDVSNTDSLLAGDKISVQLTPASASNIAFVALSLVPGSSTETSTGVLSFGGLSFVASASDAYVTGDLAFSGLAFAASTHRIEGSSGDLAFAGVSFAGSASDAYTTGGLAFGGLGFLAGTTRHETGAGVLAFKGISYVGHVAGVETGAGVMAFGPFAIVATAFDLGAGAGAQQFWTFGA
jgi:hypothetical protein